MPAAADQGQILLLQGLANFNQQLCAECHGVRYLLHLEVEEGVPFTANNCSDPQMVDSLVGALKQFLRQRWPLPSGHPVPLDLEELHLQVAVPYHFSMLFPLGTQVRPFGFLFTLSETPWPPAQVAVIGAMAQALGSLVVQLHQEVQLSNVLLTVVNSAVTAIEARDEYTGGHSARVAEYSYRVARALKLDDAQAQLVYTAAALHDIGKIGVRDSVLAKPGPLEPAEWEHIRRHPVLGEKILSPIKLLAPVLPVVRHHHERYDGRGYPDGLAGEAIPLFARIVSIADAFEAMTSHRPYRPALPVTAALAELEANGGSQFDPELVKVFLRGEIATPGQQQVEDILKIR